MHSATRHAARFARTMLPIVVASIASAGQDPVPAPRFVERHDAGATHDQRDAETILSELDALPRSVPRPPHGSDTDAFDRWRDEQTRLARRRADLVTELDASGYEGPRLDSLLATKIHAVTRVKRAAWAPFNAWSAVLWEMAARHEGTRVAAAAELAGLSELLILMSYENLTLSDESIERIARLELAALDPADPGPAGSTLRTAVTMRGPETAAAWIDWFTENLPEGSGARAWAESERKFGRPIRLTGRDQSGEPVDTHGWLGRVVLVDFWGSWCGPCIAGMPAIAAMADEFADRGFRVLGVVHDEPDAALDFLADHPEYDWPQIMPDGGLRRDEPGRVPDPRANSIVERHGIRAYPTYWLIDRQGVLHRADAARLREQIESLLGPPNP